MTRAFASITHRGVGPTIRTGSRGGSLWRAGSPTLRTGVGGRPLLRKVHLHGDLGERFGREWILDVATPGEAVRALGYQLTGFSEKVRQGRYSVHAGLAPDPSLCAAFADPESLELQLGRQTDIHIAPEGVVAGVETIILGVVLALTVIASVAAILMMKAPKVDDREEATKVASFMFDGAENSIEQGHPVPLIYGEMRVGSIVGSAGIIVSDVGWTDGTVTGGGTVGSTEGYDGENTPTGRFMERDVENPLAGGGKSGGEAHTPVEDPNNLQSVATARVLEIIGEGEIVGLVDGMKSV